MTHLNPEKHYSCPIVIIRRETIGCCASNLKYARGWLGQLSDLRDRLTGCIACGCLSLSECQLANPDDLLGAGGSGPRRLSGQPGHGQGGGEQDDGP
jgi:hypothetical protein